ncbi:MAG: hypothetical protein ACYC97_02160 [Metallibacterium sp.]
MNLNGTGINVNQSIAIYGITGGSQTVISAAGTSGGTITGSETTLFGITIVMLVFTGYVNATATAQTVNFPYLYANQASVISNDTGVVVGIDATGKTGVVITSPDNATAYSGVVLISGS